MDGLNKHEQELSQLARFPDMNPGPVIRMTMEGIVLLSNKAARNLFSRDLKEKNWKTICPNLSEEIWRQIVSSDNVYTIERSIGKLCFLFHHRPDPETQLVFVYGSDITENKKIEKKLEEQNALIEQIARFPHMNPGPVIRMDLDGTIHLCNQAAQSIFKETLNGKDWRTLCPGVKGTLWNKIISSEEVFPVEEKIGKNFFVFNHRCDLQSKLVFAFGTDITLQRAAEKQLLQNEKMATLGTLAAGVAHELNNPAAATRRASQQLLETFKKLALVQKKINSHSFSAPELDLARFLTKLSDDVRTDGKLSSLESSDAEAELEEWLDQQHVENAWDIVPGLIAMGVTKEKLSVKISGITPEILTMILQLPAYQIQIRELLDEIHEGSQRVSEIIVALKNYSYLGQAPVQEVDLHQGIDNTLIILKNKLRKGITIRRDYAQHLPKITAYGSELNQVWTNLLDNAADALKEKGEITIRTRTENDFVIIEIEDNGPGIPENIQSRIFDPFFTTKEPGRGTGLGLSTSFGIITEKHKGKISVESQTGFTRFTVILPKQISV